MLLRVFPDYYKVAPLYDDVETPEGFSLVYEGIKPDVAGPLHLSPQTGSGKKGDMPGGLTRIGQAKSLRLPPSPLSFSPLSLSAISESSCKNRHPRR